VKGEGYYIWEAKDWPLWSEGKKPIEQLREVLLSLPQILAEMAIHKGKQHEISGVLFSWWSKPEDVDALVGESVSAPPLLLLSQSRRLLVSSNPL